jgi:hypothetical protein
LKEQLDARISAARRSLFWPSLVRSALPAILWFVGFAVFWLTGFYTPLPPEVQATIGVVFWIGLLTAALIGFKVWHSPTDDEARDLIDGSIEGRPLRAWADRPAKSDASGWTLWQEHRNRMAALALKQGKIDVRPQWKQAEEGDGCHTPDSGRWPVGWAFPRSEGGKSGYCQATTERNRAQHRR